MLNRLKPEASTRSRKRAQFPYITQRRAVEIENWCGGCGVGVWGCGMGIWPLVLGSRFDMWGVECGVWGVGMGHGVKDVGGWDRGMWGVGRGVLGEGYRGLLPRKTPSGLSMGMITKVTCLRSFLAPGSAHALKGKI